MKEQAVSIEFGNTTATRPKASGQAAALSQDLWAVIPVKALAAAKQRLKDYLGPCREDFTLAMLSDVLLALADSKAITGIVVVTADRRVADIAAGENLVVVEEGGSAGLNAAIDLGIETVRRLGGARVVILPSDIPLLTGAELDRLIADFDRQVGRTDDKAIGISPSTDGGGTNCLVLNIGRAFTFHYGPGSYTIHSENAIADQRAVISLHSRTLSLDIDEPRHVSELLDFGIQHPEFQKTQTWKFLHNMTQAGRETERTLGIGNE